MSASTEPIADNQDDNKDSSLLQENQEVNSDVNDSQLKNINVPPILLDSSLDGSDNSSMVFDENDDDNDNDDDDENDDVEGDGGDDDEDEDENENDEDDDKIKATNANKFVDDSNASGEEDNEEDEDLKTLFPTSRIRTILKQDRSLPMSAGPDAIFALNKAAASLVGIIASSAHKHTERSGRRTLSYRDVALAIRDPESNEYFDATKLVSKSQDEEPRNKQELSATDDNDVDDNDDDDDEEEEEQPKRKRRGRPPGTSALNISNKSLVMSRLAFLDDIVPSLLTVRKALHHRAKVEQINLQTSAIFYASTKRTRPDENGEEINSSNENEEAD